MLVLLLTKHGKVFQVDTEKHLLPENFLRQCTAELNELDQLFANQQLKRPGKTREPSAIVFFNGESNEELRKHLKLLHAQLPRKIHRKTKSQKGLADDAEKIKNSSAPSFQVPDPVEIAQSVGGSLEKFMQGILTETIRKDDDNVLKRNEARTLKTAELEAIRSTDRKVCTESDRGILGDLATISAWLVPAQFRDISVPHLEARVSGQECHVIVDSGAIMTTMSEEVCNRLGLDLFLDRRLADIVKVRGVGEAPFVGHLHSVDLEIGGEHLDFSITVVKTPIGFLLLGIDMLRRHKCVIDFENKALIIGDGKKVVPFLHWKHTINYSIIHMLKLGLRGMFSPNK